MDHLDRPPVTATAPEELDTYHRVLVALAACATLVGAGILLGDATTGLALLLCAAIGVTMTTVMLPGRWVPQALTAGYVLAAAALLLT